jgi:hypothetical protein
MFGILCHDKIELVGHSLFQNFRMALNNYFSINQFKDINNTDDISDITHLFIVDEHFAPNKNVWKNVDFINKINSNNIRVIIFNFEKVFNSCFPWNVDNQKALETFRNYYQFISDVDDAKLLKKNVINKQFLSGDTKFNIVPNQNKINKILFIGQLRGDQYQNRRAVVEGFLSRGFPLDVIMSDRRFSYNDFLNKVNDYKYILNPLGTGKFVNLRHFEALYFGAIPIQQMTEDMIELNRDIYEHCITFVNLDNIGEKINSFRHSPQPYYLEDYFKRIDLGGYL